MNVCQLVYSNLGNFYEMKLWEYEEHLITMMVIPPEQSFFRSTVDLEEGNAEDNPNFVERIDDNLFLNQMMPQRRKGVESRRSDMVISRSGGIADRRLLSASAAAAAAAVAVAAPRVV